MPEQEAGVDERVDECLGFAFPLASDGDIDCLEAGELTILGVVHCPPPEELEVTDGRGTSNAEHPSQLSRLRVGA